METVSSTESSVSNYQTTLWNIFQNTAIFILTAEITWNLPIQLSVFHKIIVVEIWSQIFRFLYQDWIKSWRRCGQIFMWNDHNKTTQNVLGWKVCQQEMSRYLGVFGLFSKLITLSTRGRWKYAMGTNVGHGRIYSVSKQIKPLTWIHSYSWQTSSYFHWVVWRGVTS